MIDCPVIRLRRAVGLGHAFGMETEAELSLLSPPYESRNSLVWFGNRISLVDVRQGPGVETYRNTGSWVWKSYRFFLLD